MGRPYKKITIIILITIVITLTSVVSATTDTFNPEHNGIMNATASNAQYATIHDAAGSTVSTTRIIAGTYLKARGSSSGRFVDMGVAYFTFNTSSLPDNANISSATVSFRGVGKTNGLGNATFNVTNANPTNPMSYVAGDYARRGTVNIGNGITYTTFNSSGWNNITFYTNSLYVINLTGGTVLAIRDSWDVANSFDGTWSANAITAFYVNTSNAATNKPVLSVTYTIYAPVSNFTSNVTGGNAPVSVQLTDTSQYIPTSWVWNATNVTGNNTPFTFSTEQNPIVTFGQGNWSIKLNATNSGGSNISAQAWYINVSPSLPPVSSFTMRLMDTSTNSPTSWQWNATSLLGNNTPFTFSTDQNPEVTLGTGSWLIQLIATNGDGSSDPVTQTVGINLTSPTVYFWNRTS